MSFFTNLGNQISRPIVQTYEQVRQPIVHTVEQIVEPVSNVVIQIPQHVQQLVEPPNNDAAERLRKQNHEQLERDRKEQEIIRKQHNKTLEDQRKKHAAELAEEKRRLEKQLDLLNKQAEIARKAEAEAYNEKQQQVEMVQKMQDQQRQAHKDEMMKFDLQLKAMADEQKVAGEQQKIQQQKMEEQLDFMVKQSEQLKLEFLPILKTLPSKPAPMPAKTHAEVTKLRNEAELKNGMNSVEFYNFGFIGHSGVGKSSLINAIRGLRASDPGAAAIDEIECTNKMQQFPYPNFSHVILWDIPGVGTENHPEDTYFWDKKLYAFDALVILFSDRLLNVDISMAKSAELYRVPFNLVRTKSDHAVESKIEQKQMTPTEAKDELRQQVLNVVSKQLAKVGMSLDEVCCVSSRGFTGSAEQKETYGMDEHKLMSTIANRAAA